MMALLMKYHILYKTTNIINQKIYIGIHTQSIDPYEFDGYYGSGKLLQYAIDKYGEDNFVRETLEVYEDYQELRAREREIVNVDFLLREDVYNISVGGTGGNTNPHISPEEKAIIREKIRISQLERMTPITEETREKQRVSAKHRIINHPHTIPNNKNRKHVGDGLKNIQQAGAARINKFRWITNGTSTAMISRSDEIPDGWYSGMGSDIPRMVKQTPEAREKIANHPKIRGAGAYTNGIINIKVPNGECPPVGFYRGVTFKNVAITNGYENRSIPASEEIPAGWKRGSTRGLKNEK
jgi:hypothetical protein